MAILEQILAGPVSGGDGDPVSALEAASEQAPYLRNACSRRGDVLDRLKADGPRSVFDAELAVMSSIAVDYSDLADAMKAMRVCKEAAHLVIAGADLSGAWTLDDVVGALTDLADAAVQTALTLAIREGWARGRFGDKQDRSDMPGVFVLAMGKMGAHELNYSSDVDLIVLFDLDVIPAEQAKIKEGMSRLAGDLVRILEERTADGYVFRTDLRLRPDPSSTAPALSTQYALSYYESVGQNWERMAHIKARVCAGDRQVGDEYLALMQPYVWRRHLDYWAIADIHSIKRQIHSHGKHAALELIDFDVKLGRGGIREIEFFAQVQQLIYGGRMPEVRALGTKEATAALVELEMVEPDIGDDLCKAYDFLRGLEHRIQMVNDEQTHRLPDNAERRQQVALLSGYDDVDMFEADVARVRKRVHDIYGDLFAQEERLSGVAGNLMFTGVDEDPGTVATLREMGFNDPSSIIKTFQSWHRGTIRATRSARGRQIFTILGPRLLEAMAVSGEPDVAFRRFAEFFGRLSAGVQTMSLLLARPQLTEELIRTMALAPKLGKDLAQRPALLDALLEPKFLEPAHQMEPGERADALAAMIAVQDGFEGQINAARRFHREEAFRIGFQLLRGQIGAHEAGLAYADLADACVERLAHVAEVETIAKLQGDIGAWVVCAQGKFGGRELTATSDLDLMLVYDPGEVDQGIATRFVQRLVAALSAPTEEGALYEVDMQLRPSGKAGPVAVKFSSFDRYYQGEAWTWEFMALTRLRPVAGDRDLVERVLGVRERALRSKSSAEDLTKDVLNMRQRLATQKAGRSKWDVKLWPGGIVDVEFIVQHGILKRAGDIEDLSLTGTEASIECLWKVGEITEEEAVTLHSALTFQLDLQQALRIAVTGVFDPDAVSEGFRQWIAKLMLCDDFSQLEEKLQQLQGQVVEIRMRKIGALATEGGK